MMIIDEAGATLLVLSTTLLLGAASLAMLRFQRLVQTQLKSGSVVTEARPAADEIEPLKQRIGALQKIVDDLARKEKMPQQTGRQDMPIENAVRMAKCGAGIDELTKCGLKRGEAELLLRLHANRSQATERAGAVSRL
jgi:hypothetical protein